MPDKTIIRLPEVIARTGIPRSTIYALMAQDKFPHQINLGIRSVGWIADEILEFNNQRIRESLARGSSHDYSVE